MKEPKYKIGDYVWFMKYDKALEGQVYEIKETIFHSQKLPEGNRQSWEYWISYETNACVVASTERTSDDGKLFPTKQDLINSL